MDSNNFHVNRRFTIKYTKEQRLDIGRRIYEGEIDRYQAAEEYGINDYTARDYMRLYRDTYQLPHIRGTCGNSKVVPRTSKVTNQANLQEYQDMSKEELIQALIQARITETRLKKGYEVKGDGSVILYNSKNIK